MPWWSCVRTQNVARQFLSAYNLFGNSPFSPSHVTGVPNTRTHESKTASKYSEGACLSFVARNRRILFCSQRSLSSVYSNTLVVWAPWVVYYELLPFVFCPSNPFTSGSNLLLYSPFDFSRFLGSRMYISLRPPTSRMQCSRPLVSRKGPCIIFYLVGYRKHEHRRRPRKH